MQYMEIEPEHMMYSWQAWNTCNSHNNERAKKLNTRNSPVMGNDKANDTTKSAWECVNHYRRTRRGKRKTVTPTRQQNRLKLTAGTNDSIMIRRRRRDAATAIHFWPGSLLNSEKVVLNEASTLTPELDGYIELLCTVESEAMTELAEVINNSVSIIFIQTATSASILSSKIFQDYLMRNSALEL